MKLLPNDLCIALIQYLESKPINEAVGFWNMLRQLPDVPMPTMPENKLIDDKSE